MCVRIHVCVTKQLKSGSCGRRIHPQPPQPPRYFHPAISSPNSQDTHPSIKHSLGEGKHACWFFCLPVNQLRWQPTHLSFPLTTLVRTSTRGTILWRQQRYLLIGIYLLGSKAVAGAAVAAETLVDWVIQKQDCKWRSDGFLRQSIAQLWCFCIAAAGLFKLVHYHRGVPLDTEKQGIFKPTCPHKPANPVLFIHSHFCFLILHSNFFKEAWMTEA